MTGVPVTRSVVTSDTGSIVKPSLAGGVSAVALGVGAAVVSAGVGSALGVSAVTSAVGLALADGLGAALLDALTSGTELAAVEVTWLLPQPVTNRVQTVSRVQAGAKRTGGNLKAMSVNLVVKKCGCLIPILGEKTPAALSDAASGLEIDWVRLRERVVSRAISR